MRYVAFVHQDDDPGFDISFPDFPGCVSDGDILDAVIRRGGEALAFHIEGMTDDGERIPRPRSLHEIERDESLAQWREGATIAFVPRIVDKGAARRAGSRHKRVTDRTRILFRTPRDSGGPPIDRF